MKNKKSIREEIRHFGKKKQWIAIPLIVLGIVGLVLPVMPGWVLIFLGSLFLFPKPTERILNWLKEKRKSFSRKE